MEDLNTNRITRILTTDFPQYFAIVTRIRQEVCVLFLFIQMFLTLDISYEHCKLKFIIDVCLENGVHVSLTYSIFHTQEKRMPDSHGKQNITQETISL